MAGGGFQKDRAAGSGRVFTFRGADENRLPYPVGTLGVLKSVEDLASGNVRWTVDGTTPPNNNSMQTNEYYETNGPYHAAYDIPVDLGLLRFRGTSPTSRYSISVCLR